MLGLRSHILRHPDIQKVSDWYEKIFEKQPYFQNENYIGFEIDGCEFGVFADDVEEGKHHRINIYWGVEDMEKEYTRITNLWAKPLGDPVNVWGGIIMGDFEDPFGNFFGIIQHGD